MLTNFNIKPRFLFFRLIWIILPILLNIFPSVPPLFAIAHEEQPAINGVIGNAPAIQHRLFLPIAVNHLGTNHSDTNNIETHGENRETDIHLIEYECVAVVIDDKP